jgi:2-iminobutanoate/2-iminopropanoate deaminase
MTIIHSSPSAQAALEHYNVKNSTAIQVGDLYFFSGMTAIDLTTFEVSEADVATQARVTLENFRMMLEDLGLSLDHVVRVNAQLTDVTEFAAWNEVFLEVFQAPYPCRTTVGSPLVVGKIEVEITAASTPRR